MSRTAPMPLVDVDAMLASGAVEGPFRRLRASMRQRLRVWWIMRTASEAQRNRINAAVGVLFAVAIGIFGALFIAFYAAQGY